MSPEFLRAFESEIDRVSKLIEANTQTLESQEDGEAAEAIRIRIRYSQKMLATIEKSRSEIVTATAAIDSTVVKFEKWRAACRETRTAQERVLALDQQLVVAREACNAPIAAVAAAENALGRQRATPLPDYPTERERRAKKAAEDKLQKEYDSALSHLRDVAQVSEALERALLAARVEFDRLAFTERMLRLPSEPTPFKSAGTISHVA